MEIKNEIKDIDFFKWGKDVIYRIIDGECIILNLNTSIYYTLNEVGTDVWERINDNNNVMQIARQICALYNKEYNTVLNDVKNLINDLISEGLIKKVNG